jgi:hypothetical protein
MNLSTRDRRALLLLSFMAAPLLFHRLVLGPFLDSRSELLERVQREAMLLQSESSDLRDQDRYRKALAEARTELQRAAGRLFTAASRPLAEAGAAEYVRTVADLSQIQLRLVDTPGGDSIASGLGSGRIRIAGDAELLQLLVFLRRIEEGPGRIITRGIAIQPSDRRSDENAGAKLSFELALDAHYMWNAGDRQ